MSKLICDICGTSYSEGVDKCPTCGYSRAFEEAADNAAQRPAVREKVRGGRFSKKNVRKRLELMAQAGHKIQEIVPAADIAAELKAIDASVTDEQKLPPVPLVQAVEEGPVVQEQETELVVTALPPEEPEPVIEEPVQEEFEEPVEEAESEPESIVILLPEEEPEQPIEEPVQEESEEPSEETESETEPIVILLPEEESEQPSEEPVQEEFEEPGEETDPETEPIVILLPGEEPEPLIEEPEQEETEAVTEESEPEDEPIVIVLPGETAPEEPEQEAADDVPVLPEEENAEQQTDIPAVVPAALPGEDSNVEEKPAEEEKKKKGGLLINIVLYTSLAVFLASAIYLLVSFGIPYLKEMDWPTRPAAETTVPTEEPTQAPTEAPTEAPTDAPTEAPTEAPTDPPLEAPTDPPTDPPTEAPTEPLLDVKLELNYYDLTFGASNQGTQLEAKTIPNEDITWISDDPSIATISETGKIISVSGGKTTVRAIYGNQEVTVKINCAF